MRGPLTTIIETCHRLFGLEEYGTNGSRTQASTLWMWNKQGENIGGDREASKQKKFQKAHMTISKLSPQSFDGESDPVSLPPVQSGSNDPNDIEIKEWAFCDESWLRFLGWIKLCPEKFPFDQVAAEETLKTRTATLSRDDLGKHPQTFTKTAQPTVWKTKTEPVTSTVIKRHTIMRTSTKPVTSTISEDRTILRTAKKSVTRTETRYETVTAETLLTQTTYLPRTVSEVEIMYETISRTAIATVYDTMKQTVTVPAPVSAVSGRQGMAFPPDATTKTNMFPWDKYCDGVELPAPIGLPCWIWHRWPPIFLFIWWGMGFTVVLSFCYFTVRWIVNEVIQKPYGKLHGSNKLDADDEVKAEARTLFRTFREEVELENTITSLISLDSWADGRNISEAVRTAMRDILVDEMSQARCPNLEDPFTSGTKDAAVAEESLARNTDTGHTDHIADGSCQTYPRTNTMNSSPSWQSSVVQN